MRVAIFVGVLALAGCQTPEQLQASVGNASNIQLCRAIMLAPQNVASIARDEAARRSLDCAPYAQAVLANERANDDATNALARQLLTPRPPAPAAANWPAPVNCTSHRYGNQVETSCR